MLKLAKKSLHCALWVVLATGVRGIKLDAGPQKVVSLIVPKGDGAILTVTEKRLR